MNVAAIDTALLARGLHVLRNWIRICYCWRWSCTSSVRGSCLAAAQVTSHLSTDIGTLVPSHYPAGCCNCSEMVALTIEMYIQEICVEDMSETCMKIACSMRKQLCCISSSHKAVVYRQALYLLWSFWKARIFLLWWLESVLVFGGSFLSLLVYIHLSMWQCCSLVSVVIWILWARCMSGGKKNDRICF